MAKGQEKVHSEPGPRKQNETLCVLRAFQALTQSTRSISVTSVLKLFWPRRTRGYCWHEEKSSRRERKLTTSATGPYGNSLPT
jgi:hypothetical protein